MNVVKSRLASGTTGISLHCNDKNQIHITGQRVVQALNAKFDRNYFGSFRRQYIKTDRRI